MDLLEIIRKRRSIRRFKPDSIPETILDELKEAIIWAPSAGNLQSRKFYFVFDRKRKVELAKAARNQNFIAEAPLAIVACTDSSIKKYYGTRGTELYSIQDVAASVQNILLTAKSRGLGTVWVGAFNEDEVADIMNLPENLRPVAIIPVGYTDEEPTAPTRVSAKAAIKEIK